jgi:pyrroloquinoline quinone (PQQ) biosynthesis protein C
MYYEQALAATQAQRQQIESHPIFSLLRDGKFTRSHYLAFLRETYHLVKHTPHYLKAVAARVGDNQNTLREFYLEFAEEEDGHEKLCVHDIRALGENPDEVLSSGPSAGCWSLITQSYYFAHRGTPVALIGDAIATEGLGADLAMGAAAKLTTEYGLPKNAITFLNVHGAEDIEHMNMAKAILEEYATDQRAFEDILHSWRWTLHYYAQLFSDVVQLGDIRERHGNFNQYTQ